MSNERTIIGCEVYYVLLDGKSALERVDSTNIMEIAIHFQQELKGENRANVRMIVNSDGEIILLPVASIIKCFVRPVYQMQSDGQGGKVPVLS